MINSLIKYVIYTIYFFFIHYLIIFISFMFIFFFKNEYKSSIHFQENTILKLKKNIDIILNEYYKNFYTKCKKYSTKNKATLKINNLYCFDNLIGIPSNYLKEKDDVIFLETNIPYSEIKSNTIESIINLIKSFYSEFKIIPSSFLESNQKIILKTKEKTVIAYPWQTINEEIKNTFNNQKVADIRSYYKKNYQI